MLHFCEVIQECHHIGCANPERVAEIRRELCCDDDENCQYAALIPCQLHDQNI